MEVDWHGTPRPGIHYVLQLRMQDGNPIGGAVSTTRTTYTYDEGLVAGHRYRVSVTAVNLAGSSSSVTSDPTPFTPPPGTTPTANRGPATSSARRRIGRPTSR